ncbi:hypothetical protein A2W24_03440 [Microgenomates group bacterium RBG_16_45_19]|nr:MAG: hypothetical protein A2W24_03440 [Microgenomates group bacterium RBG_16_45_19]
MTKITSYWHYLKAVILMSYEQAAIYRANFILRLVRALVELAVSVIMIGAFFSHTSTLGQYSQTEAYLIAALSLLIIGLVIFFFGSGIEGLHRLIHQGTFDHLLLQPKDSMWLASTRYVHITNLFRVGFGLAFFFWVINHLNLHPTFAQSLLFSLTFISALVVYFSLMFMAATVSFWALSGELFYLFNTLISVSRYPIDIFGTLLKGLLTIFPVIFIATIPAQALLGRFNWLIWLSPFIAALSFWLTRRFWSIGLRAYESVSS